MAKQDKEEKIKWFESKRMMIKRGNRGNMEDKKGCIDNNIERRIIMVTGNKENTIVMLRGYKAK